jgi:hypothetical protein
VNSLKFFDNYIDPVFSNYEFLAQVKCPRTPVTFLNPLYLSKCLNPNISCYLFPTGGLLEFKPVVPLVEDLEDCN